VQTRSLLNESVQSFVSKHVVREWTQASVPYPADFKAFIKTLDAASGAVSHWALEDVTSGAVFAFELPGSSSASG
jgi:hypothetical protein